MSDTPRDTQFVGFARLLIPEIDEQIGAVTEWSMEHDIDDQARIAQELVSRWQTLLAQRAYDLVIHALKSLSMDPIAIGEIPNIPDMAIWPEDNSERNKQS